MKQRVIGIGETVLDILFKDNQPQKAIPGGSAFNSIVSLGRAGVRRVVGLFVESYNIFDTDAVNFSTDKHYTHYDINLDFGLTYAVHPRVQLDAYAGFNLYNSETYLSGPKNFAFFGLGVTWLIWHP